MTQPKVRAIDGDGHVGENSSKIHEYLEEPYKEFRSGTSGPGGLVPLDGWDRYLGRRLYRGAAGRTEDWVQALQRGDMEATVLYPSMGLFLGFIKDPDYQVAFARAYNTWMAKDICSAEKGVYGVGLLPTYYPDEAVKELHRIKELGLKAAMFPADGSHLLGQRLFHPVYQAAVDLDFPIATHAAGSHLGGAGVEMFPKFIQAHTVAHPFGILRQFTSVMFEGVFELFPTLRFAFLETGCTWVPWWLDRMDEEFEKRGDVEAPVLKRQPSEYVQQGGNVFFGVEARERLLGQTLDLIGNDIVMYASDYPHWDGDYPESLFAIARREDLTESQRQGLLRGAAQRFYGLD
jgi:uncharacterized protein